MSGARKPSRPVDHVALALKRIKAIDNRFEWINWAADNLRKLPEPEELVLPPDEGNRQRFEESLAFLVEWVPRMASAYERRMQAERERWP